MVRSKTYSTFRTGINLIKKKRYHYKKNPSLRKARKY